MKITNNVSQWGGAAFMLGSLLFLANKFNEMSQHFLSRWIPDVISGDDIWLVVVGQVAFIIGYVGFWQLYSERVGRWGKNALRLLCGGGIVLAVGHVAFMNLLPFDLFLLVIIGLMLMIIGLIWFGILNWRQPVLAHWQWLPLATGLMGFIGFFLFSGAGKEAVFLIFRTLFALGLLWIGLTMWLEKSIQLKFA